MTDGVFRKDFDDREGFTTSCSSKPFAIMMTAEENARPRLLLVPVRCGEALVTAETRVPVLLACPPPATPLGVSRQAVQKRFIPGEAGPRTRGQDGFWDRASDDLKGAVTLARAAARARRTTYLGTEHLLPGLAGQPQERAAQALAHCGADPATIRGAVYGRIGAPKGEPLPDETPFTRLALRSLQHALREALLMNPAAVGGEHLALGLLTVGAGVAHDVLVNLGVSYERLREAVAADGTP
jgi:Clp amino terminal domain, pathogenicity island component